MRVEMHLEGDPLPLNREGSYGDPMITELVDPRDVQHEVDQPVYRVYFWHKPAPPPGVDTQDMAFHCAEYRLEGAVDVYEVVKWATTKARAEQTFVIYVEHHVDGRPGLIRLAGRDPNHATQR